jgi:threonyl-tRNA synthetase
MKILSLHCDYLKFKPLKKAVKSISDLSEEEKSLTEVKDPLGIFVAVEKSDESKGLENSIKELIENTEDLMDKTKAKKVVLYPYAHLSSNLSSPDFAQTVLEQTEKKLKAKKIETFRAPFGYYKEFELKCKGHPLAELSRETNKEGTKEVNLSKGKDEKYDPEKLLRQVSKAKLDTSKLKENDHRILGQKLDLFSFNDVAPGMVFWHNNGLVIYNELIKFWRDEHQRADYKEIKTPQILDKKLWQISGHWEKFKENIFLSEYEDKEFAIKPMNCPGGLLVFKATPKSYKDLPLRVGEVGIVHRQELSGTLGGLFRVIQFTQDDAHVFCTEEQIEKETEAIMEMIEKFYNTFDLNFDHVELSTRPKKRIGSDEIWDKAEKTLEKVLKKRKMKFKINKGDGAFYGPKIDFHIKDSQKRTWQTSTIQLDFSMPERFNLEYTSKDNKKERPIMLHRVIYGSLERFIGVLLEEKNGNLPTWLSPIQVRVLSFTDRNIKAAEKVLKQLREAGIRVDSDFESTTIGDKVRNAELMKIPYMVTIGDKEEKTKQVAVRKRGERKLTTQAPENFIENLKKEIENRK